MLGRMHDRDVDQSTCDMIDQILRHVDMDAYAERLIGTLRRDCLDHILIIGERHSQRVLTLYSLYYNDTRTHLGLGKDAPL
jgi:Integrase core domain